MQTVASLPPLMHHGLAETWHASEPFKHIVVDQFLAPQELAALMELLEDEPVTLSASDIFLFEATAPVAAVAEFRRWQDRFAAAMMPWVQANVECAIRIIDMRAYAYREDHYLLPHTDHQDDLSRAVAYALYLPTPMPPVGGELELFSSRADDNGIIDVTSARKIEAVANRLVMFEVSPRSLHQVCEVERGLRLSIAGWFYS